MCLAIPGKVIETFEENGLKMGKLDYAGTTNTACLAYVPEIKVGQYAVVHAGFAISVIDEQEAQKTYALWDEMVETAAREGLDIFGVPLNESHDDKNQTAKK
ncbi:HypC/HybG/HupF family hydrogenase formation chaperone [candidate division KSB1 bacterium]|nr:HypC/HybG/HupF family hydrogenase formation chaperone [candidate division KSB1 bacterium]